MNHLSPILGDFLHDFPDVTVNLELNNRYVELISEGYDLAVRVGELEDSSLRARQLTQTHFRLVASESYLQKFGRPMKIEDLNAHRLLHHTSQSAQDSWRIKSPTGEMRYVRSTAWLTVNDGQSLLNAAKSGLGIAYLPSFPYAPAVERGEVVDVIPSLPFETQGIYAVYPPGRFTQPKVRAFIDFLVHSFADKGPDNW